VPEHPEKVLAITQSWLTKTSRPPRHWCGRHCADVRFAADPKNASALAEMLSAAGYLDLPARRCFEA